MLNGCQLEGPLPSSKFNGIVSARKGIWAAIGDLKDAEEIVAGTEGTVVTKDMNLPVEWRDKGSQSSNLSDKFN